MASRQTIARQAGVVYFVFMIVAIAGEFFFPAFVVAGDAAATAHNITAGSSIYRLSLLTSFITLMLFIILVSCLYKLFRKTSRHQALLMVLLVTVGVAVTFANLLLKFAPLVLLNGAGYLQVFTKDQLEALALAFLRFHGQGSAVSIAFWGLWLFPFGTLVIKSGFIPRVLGYLLMLAGFAYLATCVAAILWPEYRPVVSRFMMPLYLGEVPVIFWLLIKGAANPAAPVTPAE